MGMNIKQKAGEARNGIQKGIYCVIDPLVRLMIKCGVTPNVVTTIGLLGNIAAAVVLVWAAAEAPSAGSHVTYGRLILAGALIIGFSLFDMLDGQVARIGGMVSRFGALYDSVLDRYCELFVLGGIVFYFLQVGSLASAVITFLALIGSMMVSYVRARAEGVGIECKMGFMQRPERVVITSLAVLATGITGVSLTPESTFNPDIILMIAMIAIAVFANLTAFARIGFCHSVLSQESSNSPEEKK